MTQTPPKGVIFDLDGTLIDSAPGLHAALAATLTDLGLAAPDRETTIGFIGNGVPKLVERGLVWAGTDPLRHPDAVDAFLAHYDRCAAEGTAVYPRAQACLDALIHRGIAIALCTNKPTGPTEALIAALGLGPFASVICGDTLPVRKPDPGPLLRAVADLGLGVAETVYVGDSSVDWRTAQAAGIRYVHVAGGYQRGPIPDFEPWHEIRTISQLETII